MRTAFDALLTERGLEAPDGRPLYRYGFTRSEYEGVGLLLRAGGVRGLGSREGAALFVAFAAEWFRRDRAGGHWVYVVRCFETVGVRI